MRNIVINCVFLKDRKMALLEKRKITEDNYAGLWAFPGGHKEPGEELEAALKREMREELNVKLLKYSFIGTFGDIDPTSGDLYQHNAFLCTGWLGEIKGTSEEEKVRWFDIDDIETMKGVSSYTLRILKKIKEDLDGSLQ